MPRNVRFALHKSFLVFFLIIHSYVVVKKGDVIDDYQCMCANSEDIRSKNCFLTLLGHKWRGKNIFFFLFVQASGRSALIKIPFYSFLIYPNYFIHQKQKKIFFFYFLLPMLLMGYLQSDVMKHDFFFIFSPSLLCWTNLWTIH